MVIGLQDFNQFLNLQGHFFNLLLRGVDHDGELVDAADGGGRDRQALDVEPSPREDDGDAVEQADAVFGKGRDRKFLVHG